MARDLREAIVEGRLKPNDRIKQDAVAKQFAVSRIPVREALRELASEGLVTLERDVGARVAALGPRELLEVYFLREAIEPMMVAESARRITDQELAEVRSNNEISERFAEANDPHGYLRCDEEFHLALLAPAEMPRAMSIFKSLWLTGKRFRTMVSVLPRAMELSVVEHRLILDAMERRAADDVADLYRVHIRRTRERLVQHSDLFSDDAP